LPGAFVTHGILQDANPADWKRHRFGLAPDRWTRLAGKVIWVTGAGTGFGQSLAVGLAAAGARVILSGRRRAKLEESCAEMRRFGIDPTACLICPVDITDPADVERAMTCITDRFGALDGVIANAGTFLTGLGQWPLMDQDPADWDRQFNLNVKAQWLVARAGLPLMAAGGETRILFITSEAGWAYTPSAGHYNVSKAALNNLGASLAAECADRYPDKDIQINVVAPGEARTEMNQGSDTSPYSLVSMALILLSHPRGGPNGRFFFKDGRHLAFAYAEPWDRPLM
jgi:NAD(P)-dependent dehydrogenase (short-subunit alcohol dehydrogenase family)